VLGFRIATEYYLIGCFLVGILGLQESILPNFKVVLPQIEDVSHLCYFGEIFNIASIDEYDEGFFLLFMVDHLNLHHVIPLDVFSMRGSAVDDQPDGTCPHVVGSGRMEEF
jgi:hypothetical protein